MKQPNTFDYDDDVHTSEKEMKQTALVWIFYELIGNKWFWILVAGGIITASLSFSF